MDKLVFDGRTSEIIEDSSRNIISKDGYVGDDIYKINLNTGELFKDKTEYFLYATLNKSLICINDVRKDLDEGSAGRMLGDLVKKISNSCEIIPSLEVDLVSNPNEDAKNIEQPIVIRIVSSYIFKAEDKLSKVICNDVIDWLDELKVMKSAKVSEREKENYHQEYEKIMSASLIPHEEQEIKNYSTTMSILTLTITILGIFIRNMCVLPVVAAVSAFFSGYRCYTNKNTICCIICAVCGVVALICAYVGWNEFMTSFRQ